METIVLVSGFVVGSTIVALLLGMRVAVEDFYKDWKSERHRINKKKEEKEKRDSLILENKVIRKYESMMNYHPISNPILFSMREVNKEIDNTEKEIGTANSKEEQEQFEKITEKIEKSKKIIEKTMTLSNIEKEEIQKDILTMLNEIKHKIKETKEIIMTTRKENVREKFSKKIEEVIMD